MDNTEI